MYLDHFGLSESPFRITPHTEFFFSGANRGATLEALLYAITSDEGIVKVTGEVGSGKTMLCRVLIERLPPEVETVYLANPSLEKEEIVQAILDDLKFTAAGDYSSNQLLRALQDHLISLYGAGKKVVLLIDEAHAMPPETLEQIRLLSNLESNRHKLLQIALFGQQELDDHLATTLLRPLRERITHSFKLEPLVHADVGQYLMFRMRQAGYKGPDLFNRDAVKLIANASEGLTRRLNILADKSLLAAFTEGEHGITAKHARAAIRDSGFAPLARRSSYAFFPPSWRVSTTIASLALVAVGAVTGVGAFYWLGRTNPPQQTQSTPTIQPSSTPPQSAPTAPNPPAQISAPVVQTSAATSGPSVAADAASVEPVPAKAESKALPPSTGVAPPKDSGTAKAGEQPSVGTNQPNSSIRNAAAAVDAKLPNAVRAKEELVTSKDLAAQAKPLLKSPASSQPKPGTVGAPLAAKIDRAATPPVPSPTDSAGETRPPSRDD